jgi:RND family efflux transporter MFP subunit
VHAFSVQGNVETDRNATVMPEFSGLIEKLNVKEGERVKAGQILARINSDVLRRSEAELRTQLTLAADLYDRQERLWKQGLGSEVQYLQAKTQKEALERSLETLQEQMAKAVVRAPFSGVVDRIFVKEGEMAAPGMPFARVIDLRDLFVRADLSDHYIPHVQRGTPATVIVSGIDTVRTRVDRVGSFIQPSNRTIEITLPLPAGSKFLPNMFASVRIEDVREEKAIVLPSSRIQQDMEGRDYVFVAKGDGPERTIEKRVIRVGLGAGDQMQVLEGLASGEEIVDQGATRVVEGQTVRVKS